MSRIGKQPIPLDGAKVSVDGTTVKVEGPKGKLAHDLPRGITAEVEGAEVRIQRADDTKAQRALHGLYRSLVANAVTGCTKGFEKKLEIHGVGYQAAVKGKSVNFKLGYSHPIDFPLPDGIAVAVERNVITVSGHDRQQVGQVAADMRALRPPDVYKQKGVRYADERLRKKAGKTGSK